MPRAAKRVDQWSIVPGDLPSEKAMEIEPRLREAADNAVFRLLVYRRRPHTKGKPRRKPELPALGKIPHRHLADLIRAGYRAEDYSLGLWAAAIPRKGRREGDIVAGLFLALTFLALFMIPPQAIIGAAQYLFSMLFFLPFVLTWRRGYPYGPLPGLAAMVAEQRKRYERILIPRKAAQEAFWVSMRAVFWMILILGIGILLVGATVFVLSLAQSRSFKLPFEITPWPFVRAFGVLLAAAGAAAGEARGRYVRKHAEEYEARLMHETMAISWLLGEEEAHIKVTAKKR